MSATFDLDDGTFSEEQTAMLQTCRRYVDRVLRPFIAADREREWMFEPEMRLPAHVLEEADRADLRSLGVPEQYGGVALEREPPSFTTHPTSALACRPTGESDPGLGTTGA
ncbi:MAG: acyl-CoA dehydrogenase family protein [Acidimicrobiales bacterium]